MTVPFKDKQLAPVRAHLERAHEAMQRRETAEGVKHFRLAHEAAAERGIRSAFILWNLAAASDYSGELEAAFDAIVAALALDPFSGVMRDSFDIIARKTRAALAAEGRAVDDPTTPKLYALLLQHGEADVSSHAAMARFHVAAGNASEAAELAGALTTLHPEDPDAWSCRRDVARALGDGATVEACEVELAALATPARIPALTTRKGVDEMAS
jgi:hypothetical protein